MKAKILVVLALSGMVMLLTPAASAANVQLVWTSPTTSIVYYLTTGSTGGTCWTIADEGDGGGANCFGTNGYSSVTAGGCGTVDRLGSCIAMNTLQDPTPTGTTSVKCANGTIYTVTDGGTGQCPPTSTTNGGSVSCSQQGTNNVASASCENGCGAVDGNGSCTVK